MSEANSTHSPIKCEVIKGHLHRPQGCSPKAVLIFLWTVVLVGHFVLLLSHLIDMPSCVTTWSNAFLHCRLEAQWTTLPRGAQEALRDSGLVPGHACPARSSTVTRDHEELEGPPYPVRKKVSAKPSVDSLAATVVFTLMHNPYTCVPFKP